MGLDLAFDRRKAKQAGLKFEIIPNDGSFDEDDDPAYIEWCKSSTECIQIPGCDWYVSNDASGDKSVIVRANKWGSTYAPLTNWLKEHNITWKEF